MKTKVQYGIAYKSKQRSSNKSKWVKPKKLYDTLSEAVNKFNDDHGGDCRTGRVVLSERTNLSSKTKIVRVASSVVEWGLFLVPEEWDESNITYEVYFDGNYYGTIKVSREHNGLHIQKMARELINSK